MVVAMAMTAATLMEVTIAKVLLGMTMTFMVMAIVTTMGSAVRANKLKLNMSTAMSTAMGTAIVTPTTM